MVQLPYAGSLLREAFQLIEEATSTFYNAPLQSMDRVSIAVSRYDVQLMFADSSHTHGFLHLSVSNNLCLSYYNQGTKLKSRYTCFLVVSRFH